MKCVVNHKIGYILSCIVLCVVGCTEEKIPIATKQLQYIDSLNTKAFAYVRQQKWEDSYAVAQTADSLANRCQYKKGRAKSLRIQAYYWNSRNKLDSAFYVLQKSEQIEKKLKNYKGVLAVYNTKALVFKKNRIYTDALLNYKKGLAIIDSSITQKQQSRTHLNIANVYTRMSVYDSAIYHYQQSLFLNKDTVTNRQNLLTYKNLGNVYSLSDNYKEAAFYYDKALHGYKEDGKTIEIAKLYNNLGAMHYEKGDDSTSLVYFKKSIALKEEIGNALILADGYLNIAELYAEKDNKLSLAYLEKAERLFTAAAEPLNIAKAHIARATIFQSKKQISKAKQELAKAITLSKNTTNHTLNRYIAKKQSELAYSEGNFKEAYAYKQQYVVLNDSVFNEEELWKISRIQESHQAQIKKAEVTILENERLLAEEKAFRKQEENEKLYASLIAFGIILLLILIIGIYFYKLRKASNELANQQKLLLNERIQNLVNDQEIQIINATLLARKHEKEDVSKELHNNIGSLLTSVKFHYQAFDEDILHADKGTKKLHLKIGTIIDTITEEVRALSHRFDQDPVPDFNLKNAIEIFSKQVENSNLTVNTAIHGLDEFKNSQVSIFIFRILQELVNNTIKHAQASALTIYATNNSDTINIMVEDNGKGFDVRQKNRGIGLKNLRKQIMEMGGVCDIDSGTTIGTTVNIDIPIH